MKKEILTQRFGKIDPMSMDDYIKHGGYKALEKAVSMSPGHIIKELKVSELKGRGGAGFPLGLKMEAVNRAIGEPKYVICNADEGEPGNFKDRYLMEKDPHQLVEGMIISAIVTGAQQGYIFLRGEYINAGRILENALEQARSKGYLGENILDSGKNFDIDIHHGAGSYVCGEEFALLASLEGRMGRSDYKPPFPTTNGLYDKPTLLNNVETLSNVPWIVKNSGAKYAKLGTESSKGTKLISLCGHVNNPGLYEVEFGTTYREIIDGLGGGVAGSEIKMVQLAGASGPLIPESMLDMRLDYKEAAEAGLSFGSGAIIVMNETVDTLDILKRILEFFRHESCGKCTPCREGLIQTQILLDRFIDGTAQQKDLDLLKVLIDTISVASICGLGQAAPTSIKTALEYFSDAFKVTQAA
jgi:NADH-quinone oxidoreductase subunit F